MFLSIEIYWCFPSRSCLLVGEEISICRRWEPEDGTASCALSTSMWYLHFHREDNFMQEMSFVSRVFFSLQYKTTVLSPLP